LQERATCAPSSRGMIIKRLPRVMKRGHVMGDIAESSSKASALPPLSRMYLAREVAKIDNGPGVSNSLRVGVFRKEGDREEQIGEYRRDYHTLFRTFYPFSRNGRDFALYSPHYTCTRVMELPSCKDIGGEEKDAWGFCPVDYFVPSYMEYEFRTKDGRWIRVREHDSDCFTIDNQPDHRLVTPVTYYDFGFVAGCVWGDDSSWKIQYLDLSRADSGSIRRDARFGYIRLPTHLHLDRAIRMDGFQDAGAICIATEQEFDLKTGKPPAE